MTKVTVYFWENGETGIIHQKYSRRISYTDYPKFLGTVNDKRKELFGTESTLKCGHFEFPNQDIHVLYVDADTGEEFKDVELKNMCRIETRRKNIIKRSENKTRDPMGGQLAAAFENADPGKVING